MTDGPVTIFLIDDDAGALASLAFLVECADMLAVTFRSAHDFLATPLLEVVGCVVTDFRMPQMNGLELQQTLAARGSKLPVILISGQSDLPVRATAFRNGAVDFLEKPVNGERLLNAIRSAIICSQQVVQSQ